MILMVNIESTLKLKGTDIIKCFGIRAKTAINIIFTLGEWSVSPRSFGACSKIYGLQSTRTLVDCFNQSIYNNCYSDFSFRRLCSVERKEFRAGG